MADLSTIALESPEYHKLDLNDRIRVFNREVHAFEDKQADHICDLWNHIQKEFIQTNRLTNDKVYAIRLSFAQALSNLSAMQKSQSYYEASLYHKSFHEALERIKIPSRRHRFIMLQSESIVLAHDAHDVKERLVFIKKELNEIKKLYDKTHQPIFDRALRVLTELSQIKDPTHFNEKRKLFLNILADIHEQANTFTESEKDCDELVEEASKRGQAIFEAKSAYLEDKNSWMARASDIAEKSWVGIGTGLAVVPIALGIAIPAIIGGVILAPVAGLAIGLAGAAYGVVDFARTTASTITNSSTVKLGARPVAKPEKTFAQKAKSFLKKAAPVALCFAALAIGVAAVVFTGGIAAIGLGVAGAVVGAAGVGWMAKQKYDEKKEVDEIKAQHKALNETFNVEAEQLQKKSSADLKEQFKDSKEEGLAILQGHALTDAQKATLKNRQPVMVANENLAQANISTESDSAGPSDTPEAAVTEMEVLKQNHQPENNPPSENPDDDSEDDFEGDSETEGDSGASDSEAPQPPIPRL